MSACQPIPTSFVRLGRRPARLVLLMAALTLTAGVAITLSPLKNDRRTVVHDGSDVALYRAEVARMRAGEDYYAVAGDELRTRGYPTRSVFNWRTPLPMWLIAQLPELVWGKAALVALALATLLTAFALVARERSVLRTTGCMLLLIGGCLPCVLGDLYVMPGLWAGVLIALSICLFGLDRWRWGVAVGVAAMFCRDLAVPYALLSLGIAFAERRRGETWGWLAGLLAYGVFFAFHVQSIAALALPGDHAHEHGWICAGGAAFVISTVQMNGFLLVLPQWVSAIYLTFALLGFAGWNSPGGRRAGIVASGYLALFALVGQPFNQYWGELLAPLLCLGAAGGIAALGDLLRRAELPLSRRSCELKSAVGQGLP